jgi:glycine oxidase
MADTTWDVIIVGQGLAGTTLAWQLQEAGQRVLLIDAQEPVTSSKIAAGLMTPITGQRLALSWRASELLPVAQKFYGRIEALTGQTFFHARRAVRLFKTDEERRAWSERSLQPAFQAYLVNPPADPLLEPELADTSGGGFEMYAAQLDVAAYLEASRSSLEHEPITLDWHRDVTFGSEDVSVQGRKAKRLISCEGFAAARNPYFAWMPFNAAKGDILTVRFHRPVPPKCLHRGIWLAPTSNPDIFRAGSSYDLTTLDQVPSASARLEIENNLQEFLRVPYTVIQHQAAVRPIIQESKALIGMHPRHDRLGFFNGLGSKGALHAPWFAQCFTEFLARGVPIPAAHDVQKHF